MVVDLSDLFLRSYLQLGGVSDYQGLDKWLDQAYLATFLIVALRWEGLARSIAVALYLFRLAGFVVFQLTGDRIVLLFFPNVFEFWFVYVAAVLHWDPRHMFSRRESAVALVVLTLLKVAHEAVLHGTRWLDSFTPRDVVDWVLRR